MGEVCECRGGGTVGKHATTPTATTSKPAGTHLAQGLAQRGLQVRQAHQAHQAGVGRGPSGVWEDLPTPAHRAHPAWARARAWGAWATPGQPHPRPQPQGWVQAWGTVRGLGRQGARATRRRRPPAAAPAGRGGRGSPRPVPPRPLESIAWGRACPRARWAGSTPAGPRQTQGRQGPSAPSWRAPGTRAGCPRTCRTPFPSRGTTADAHTRTTVQVQGGQRRER